MRLLALLGIMAISAGASAEEPPKADLYVALHGKDSNPGTAEAPLASIARARDLLRPRLAAGMNSDVRVLIYLDGVRADLGCRGYRFEKNVVYRTEHPLFFCQCSENGNTWHDNLFQQDAPPKEKLEAIANEAGLEPAYRQKLPAKP